MCDGTCMPASAQLSAINEVGLGDGTGVGEDTGDSVGGDGVERQCGLGKGVGVGDGVERQCGLGKGAGVDDDAGR